MKRAAAGTKGSLESELAERDAEIRRLKATVSDLEIQLKQARTQAQQEAQEASKEKKRLNDIIADLNE